MSHDMFGDVVRPSVRLGSRSWYTVSLSIAAHVAVTAVIVVVPLMATDVLPTPSKALQSFVASAPPPIPPPPPAAQSPAQKQATPAPANPAAAPLQAPTEIVEESRPVSVPETTVGVEGLPGGVPGGTGSVIPIVPPPPPPPRTEPVRPGGLIKFPAKTKDVRPLYPGIAQASRVEGRVIIEAVIGIDGRVKDARVLKSIPLLDRAALDAVMQWQFTPTTLNGVPVPVIMTVTVNFTLQ